MILSFIEKLEREISRSPLVISSTINKYLGPSETAYVTGSIIFIDFSRLELSIFMRKIRKRLIFEKYRFHYMAQEKGIIFRYDNAPHYRELATFPHHKHLENDQVIESGIPMIEEIMAEIAAIITRNPSK